MQPLTLTDMFNEPALRKLLKTLGVTSAKAVTIGQVAPTPGPAPAAGDTSRPAQGDTARSGVQAGTTRPGAGAQYFAAMGDRATIITVAEFALLKAWGAKVDDTALRSPPTDR